MAQPLLHPAEDDILADGLHAEAVPQALGAGVRAGWDAGGGNDLLYRRKPIMRLQGQSRALALASKSNMPVRDGLGPFICIPYQRRRARARINVEAAAFRRPDRIQLMRIQQ